MAKKAVAPSFGQELGLTYKRWTLDCVVEIAHAVALDFSGQPEQYKQVPDDTAAKLTELQASYGFQADIPDTPERLRLMKRVFGESDGLGSENNSSAFQTYRLPVLAAAANFAESGPWPPAFPVLRKAVQSAIEPLKAHMTQLQGASLSQTEARIGFIFDIAQKILQDQSVGARFNITQRINKEWPLESPQDPLGAQLIEQITTQLPELHCGVISREMFVHIQQIARDGFESIRDIVDKDVEDPNFDIDPLIAQLYAWRRDLLKDGGTPPQQQPLPIQPSAAVAYSAAR